MAYTHTTWAALKTELANRLGDASKIFWVDAELEVLLTEALRTFGLCSGFWRERGTFASTAATVFYDLPTLLSSLLSYTVTDQDIIEQIEYALLEDATSQVAWAGTEQFTYNDLVRAITNRRNQFLSDTGIVVNRSVVAGPVPPVSRLSLAESIIDVRRVSWIGASPENYYQTLWREDERLLTAADPFWSVTAGTPAAYSIMAPPPLTLQLAPPPISSGQLELLTVDSVAQFTPDISATVIGIPDDLTPAIKWGALADLLGIDGIARDVVRSTYCEQRYQMYVMMARLLPVVIHSEINGAPLIASTLQELDASTPLWQNQSGQPVDVVLASANLLALNPPPDTAYSVTLDVVRRTPIPANDAAMVQLGREQLDMILDYAEHLALFKVAGPEFHATDRQAQNFIMQATTYNQRLSAAARAVLSAAMQSQRQKEGIPRRLESGLAIGALRGTNG